MPDDLLSDSNALVALVGAHHVDHQIAIDALDKLHAQGARVWITPQCLVEFWNVATRPSSQNGLGLTPAEAEHEAHQFLADFPILPDDPAVFLEWLSLVTSEGIVGKQVNDARLVAVMRAYGIVGILTFDTTHFRRFSGIRGVHPADV